jgi:Tfp pilus assembly protein PilF
MEKSAANARRPDRLWLRAAVLGVVTLIVYLPALRGGFIFDDNVFLTENPLIAASDGLRRFWLTREALDYWPITSSTLWLEWRLWGAHAAGYHATNVMLHIAEVLLLWRLLRRLGVPGAFFGALLFALHPLNAESVTWITQRKNLLGMLFYLLSVFWYLTPRRNGELTGLAVPAQPGGGYYALALLGFGFAMLSKGSVVILPLVLLGIVLWHRRPTGRDALRLAPFFVVAVGLALFEATFSTVAAPVSVAPHSLLERGLRAAVAIWFYLGKALWPFDLSFDYGRWNVGVHDVGGWLAISGIVAVTAVGWIARRRRMGKPALFAWGYFCVALLPALGFAEVGFMKYSPVSNHYAHLALAGFAAAVGWLVAVALERVALRVRRALLIALAAAVALLAVFTWRQNLVYSDAERLYRDTLARNPSSALAHTNLGALLILSGQFKAAAVELESAVRLTPDSSKAHDNLGLAWYRLGRVDAAVREYREALRLAPDFFEAHNNLGAALARSGRVGEAIDEFKEALRINPDYENARKNLERAERMVR